MGAARYLSEQIDESYAKHCQEVILGRVGVVTLPSPPCGADHADISNPADERIGNNIVKKA